MTYVKLVIVLRGSNFDQLGKLLNLFRCWFRPSAPTIRKNSYVPVYEVSELALKYTDTNSTRAAYARSQLFDERKKVLAVYSKYAITGQSLANANVIPIKRGAS